jgi:hypothetical protein
LTSGRRFESWVKPLLRSGGAGHARIAEDVDSADLGGVAGTPTFFISGRRHSGLYDVTTLAKAVKAAGARDRRRLKRRPRRDALALGEAPSTTPVVTAQVPTRG